MTWTARVAAGRAGAEQVSARRAVCVIVDALRASATTAALLQAGAREIAVVEQVQEAFELGAVTPGAVLVGERGGPKVPGFDLGNSPAGFPAEAVAGRTVVFSSSNCSRCCVGAREAAATFLGTVVTATAVTEALTRTVDQGKEGAPEVVFVPAGSANDEALLVPEDWFTCGLLLERLREAGVLPVGAEAERALALWAEVGERGLREAFAGTPNGTRLTALGFGADVAACAALDALQTVPRLRDSFSLPGGGAAAVLRSG